MPESRLVFANADGIKTVDTKIGSGMKGVDLWPKLD